MDCNLPGSSIHGISQERTLGWVVISFSSASSRLRDQTCISCTDRQILYYWTTREVQVKGIWLLFSSSVVSDSLQPHGLQHARLPCPSPFPWVSSNSCPLSQWCHPTISSSVVPFSSSLQSFPALGSFLMKRDYLKGFLFSGKDLDLYQT